MTTVSRPVVCLKLFFVVSDAIIVVSCALELLVLEGWVACEKVLGMATNRNKMVQKKQVNAFNVNYECYFCLNLNLLRAKIVKKDLESVTHEHE